MKIVCRFLSCSSSRHLDVLRHLGVDGAFQVLQALVHRHQPLVLLPVEAAGPRQLAVQLLVHHVVHLERARLVQDLGRHPLPLFVRHGHIDGVTFALRLAFLYVDVSIRDCHAAVLGSVALTTMTALVGRGVLFEV